LIKNYFDPETGDFCKNVNAANAFAVDIGIGDHRTLENLVRKYDTAACFDTGIFGTELLIRILGNSGRADVIYKLLSSKVKDRSFYSMHERGATTLWEYWHGQRSHSHPMFGGCFKALWTVFLGITALEAGYSGVRIAPCDIAELGNMSGYLTTPQGKLALSLERSEKIKITVTVPENTSAEFEFRSQKETLSCGIHEFEF
jgi:alpha-L-rhamnosidase